MTRIGLLPQDVSSDIAIQGRSRLLTLVASKKNRKGDYHRYLAEFAAGDGRKASSEAAHESYKTASTIASSELAPTHPIRLGLALNFSVFYYEILNASRALRLPSHGLAKLNLP